MEAECQHCQATAGLTTGVVNEIHYPNEPLTLLMRCIAHNDIHKATNQGYS